MCRCRGTTAMMAVTTRAFHSASPARECWDASWRRRRTAPWARSAAWGRSWSLCRAPARPHAGLQLGQRKARIREGVGAKTATGKRRSLACATAKELILRANSVQRDPASSEALKGGGRGQWQPTRQSGPTGAKPASADLQTAPEMPLVMRPVRSQPHFPVPDPALPACCAVSR